MPTYVYVPAEGETGCASCGAGLEVRHGVNEPGPETCPACGARLRREFTPPNLGLRWNEQSNLSESSLKRHGFKTVRNEGDGTFSVR